MVDLKREFQFMREALAVSSSALEVNEVPIGCIFVLNDKIIASGFNQTNISLCGIRHAEIVAIDNIFKMYESQYSTNDIVEKVFANCELYVSVEPCIMCASALRQLKIKKVVFGCGNDRFGGNGTVVNVNRGFPDGAEAYPREYFSYPGILQKEAIMLLRKFYVQENGKAPNPKVKKNRNFVDDEFPPIDYKKYLNREDFIDFYGEEHLRLFEGEVGEVIEPRVHKTNYEHQEIQANESKKRKL